MAYYFNDNGSHNRFRSKANSSLSSQRITILVTLVVATLARSTYATKFTKNGQTCECMPFTSCSNQENIMGDTNPCNGLDVCCVETETMDKNLGSTNETAHADKPSNTISCGQKNEGIDDRISGGTSAKFVEFPWMVAILESKPSNPSSPNYVSGGSLIHPRVVLTAYHRINRFYKGKIENQLVIRAGEWDFSQMDVTNQTQNRHVSKIVKHENYNSGTLQNDIALVFVNEPFILNYQVGTICLPPQGFEYKVQRCISSGWGSDASSKTQSNILKKIELPLVSNDKCLNLLKSTNKLAAKFTLHENFMCAGGEINKDTCQGDGGSPLVCLTAENSQQYHQAGIVSWGLGCGEEIPGVYVNVAKMRQWIDQQMIVDSLDTAFYDASKSQPV